MGGVGGLGSAVGVLDGVGVGRSGLIGFVEGKFEEEKLGAREG